VNGQKLQTGSATGQWHHPGRHRGASNPRFLARDRGLSSLLIDAVEDRGPTLVQLSQIPQPLLERTQLGVIERPGRLLAVAGNKGHRRSAVEHREWRRHAATQHLEEIYGDKTREKKASAGKENALQKALQPSKELAAVVGSAPLARGQVVSKMWEYIRSHNLQNPENRREILADDKLTKVFGKNKVTMFEMNKHLTRHLT
jgi:upstream activation factor subunit UAF30